MTVSLLNFGCRLNIAEGAAIRDAARASGANQPMTIINSCAVTAEATRQARQAARRARRERPGDRVIVTGCAAQIDSAGFAAMPEVDAVLGNRDKRMAHAYRGGSMVSDVMATAPAFAPVVSGADHARAFVEVQTGCDHRCTFCVIPLARGPSVSARPDAVIAAVQTAVERNHQEVVLTGVDATSYAGGLGPLVAQILRAVPELPRLRLSSLDPVEIDPLLFELIASEPRVMPHVHLSLQHGHDLILKRMKRRHSAIQAMTLVNRLKAARPDIAVGADLIAGFPTETDEHFAASMAILDNCDVVFAHIFPYSPRAGTPAARMPQLPAGLARERSAALRARAMARQQAWLDRLIGTRQRVLVELAGTNGHGENFARVTLPPSMPGTIVDVEVTARDGDRVTGVMA